MNDDNDFSGIDEVGRDFVPQPAIRPGLDTLPDGSYEFEILDAELTKAQNGDNICNLGLRANKGAIVQHTYWLTRPININRLGYDFGILGIDTDDWNKSVKVSQGIAAATKRLPGTKFKGTKSHRFVEGKNGSKDATYHDLNIAQRLGTTPTAEKTATGGDQIPF